MDRSRFTAWFAGIVLIAPSIASAQIVCPDSSSATVTFSRVFTGLYRTGQPYDVVTIDPTSNLSESFAETGITIDVVVKNCQGVPIAGVPRQEIVLFNSALCICPGGNVADAATDLNGRTQFTGRLSAGGCVNNLAVFVDGVLISILPVLTNSPDALPASPCFVDAGDLPQLSARRGSQVGQPNYSICQDFNEDGFIDAGDIAFLALHFGGDPCP